MACRPTRPTPCPSAPRSRSGSDRRVIPAAIATGRGAPSRTCKSTNLYGDEHMSKKYGALRLTVIAAAAILGANAVQADELEVLHWWTSGGEAKAAAELKKMMEAEGHTWKDF